MKLAPTVKLNNGYEMPILGLGTYNLKKSRCVDAVRHALELGYRHIDTAFLYRNEGLVGKVLGEFVGARKVQREQVFLVTKLWDIYHEPKRVQYACELQLKQLAVDYIDLYLMHSPVGVHYNSDEDMMPHLENGELWTNNVDYLDTYKSMEQLVDLGLVRSLGLSNFNLDQLQSVLLSCRIKPAALQIECHPELVQIPLMELCKLHNITVVAYSPLGRPTTGRPLPEFYKDRKVVEMAEKYQKTPAQVVLRYLIDLGTVPIPKAAQKGHLMENLDVFDFQITTEELLHFKSFNRGHRIWKFEKAKHHQYYPYSKDNEGEAAVKHAIDVGYRHIDTAFFYQNEAEVGKAIRDKIAEGVVKREDIFLVTKLWNVFHDPALVEGICRKQLANFGLDYIDLYLMHMPVGYKYTDETNLMPKDENDVLQLSDVDYLDTYKAMEKLVKLGLVRSIGVSNFNSEQLARVLANCEIKPVTNQVECSPALNQKALTAFCKKNDVTLTGYTPLGKPKPDIQKPDFIYSPEVTAIAQKYGKTTPQVVLRYLVGLGVIPIPKSSNPKRISENFDIFDFELTPEEMTILDGYHTGERVVALNLIKGQNHKYYPFAIEF